LETAFRGYVQGGTRSSLGKAISGESSRVVWTCPLFCMIIVLEEITNLWIQRVFPINKGKNDEAIE